MIEQDTDTVESDNCESANGDTGNGDTGNDKRVTGETVVYDVTVDFGNGTHVRIEKGLSRVAAQKARKRVSKFFQGVRVVERSRKGRPRGPSPDDASD